MIRRIVSGGQTGVDQAALRAGRAVGLEIGGWCPPGRVSEAGVIPATFELRETPQERSALAPKVPRSQRTEWNVRDADATLVVSRASATLDPGTAFACRCAERLGRPVLVIDPDGAAAAARVVAWANRHRVETLNVAGPSEANDPGIGEATEALLLRVLSS